MTSESRRHRASEHELLHLTPGPGRDGIVRLDSLPLRESPLSRSAEGRGPRCQPPQLSSAAILIGHYADKRRTSRAPVLWRDRDGLERARSAEPCQLYVHSYRRRFAGGLHWSAERDLKGREQRFGRLDARGQTLTAKRHTHTGTSKPGPGSG